MEKRPEHIVKLWESYLKSTASMQEVEELYQYSRDASLDDQNYDYARQAEALLQAKDPNVQPPDWILEQILQGRISPDVSANHTGAVINTTPAHRVHFLKTAWFRYAAAILLLIGVGAYLFMTHTQDQDTGIGAQHGKPLQADIPAGGNKAVLTLADGTEIVLDDAANGNLARQGSTDIKMLANRQIIYMPKGSEALKGLKETEVLMNTISTPKGGQYQLILPDGTGVWLNAASSITFPTAFVGKERNVRISGEAYFEVAKNNQQPFIVDINDETSVHVLGTSFNINSYPNEGFLKTALVEGAVKVIKAGQSAMLKPGQQAQIPTPAIGSSEQQATGGKGNRIQVKSVNLSQVLAWKNGLFDFNGLELREVMRQLERWYNIDVQYQGAIDEIIFQGEMDRGVPLSGVLSFFSLEKKIKAKLIGRTLIIARNV